MKLNLLFSCFFVFTFIIGCSDKNKIFDDSRKCSLQSEDIKDAFGKVIIKSNSNNDCPQVNLDPCAPQLKNRDILGEVTDDTDNSIIVCPEVKVSPVLPSDYTEDTAGEIDISEALENEDTEFLEKVNAQKSIQELEAGSLVVSNSSEEEQTPVFEGQKNKIPPVVPVSNKKNQPNKTSKKVVSQKKQVSTKSTVSTKIPTKGIVYKISLGPFYSGKTYIPYRVKVEFENNLQKFQSKYKKNQKFHYKFIAYFPVGREGQDKEVAAQRSKQLVEYASWKGKVDMSSFQLVLKPTKVKSQSQSVDVLVSLR